MDEEEQIISVIPEQLIRARESLGLESKEVAEALHIDEKRLDEWEKGITEPPVENLWNLAELYRRSTDYFLRPLPALPERLSFRLESRKAVRDLPQSVRQKSRAAHLLAGIPRVNTHTKVQLNRLIKFSVSRFLGQLDSIGRRMKLRLAYLLSSLVVFLAMSYHYLLRPQ